MFEKMVGQLKGLHEQVLKGLTPKLSSLMRVIQTEEVTHMMSLASDNAR